MSSQRSPTLPSHHPQLSQPLCPSHPPAPSLALAHDTSLSFSSPRTSLHTPSHSISTQFQQPRSSLPTNPTHPNLTTPDPILPHFTSRTSKNPPLHLHTHPRRTNHPTNHPQSQESTTTGLPNAIVTCLCGANGTGVIAAALKAAKSSSWFLLG